MTYTKDDVAPVRTVGGKPVALTDSERQAIADRWNANEADRVRKAASLQPLTMEDAERLFRRLNVTDADIAAVQRDRGKPVSS